MQLLPPVMQDLPGMALQNAATKRASPCGPAGLGVASELTGGSFR